MIQWIKSIVKNTIPARYYSNIVNLYHYYGFDFKCPFCHGNFIKLDSFGFDFAVLKEWVDVGDGQRNVTCPRCGSFDWERLIYLYLMRRTRLFRDDVRLIHFAPVEQLRKVLMTIPNINYFSTDLAMQSVMSKVDITYIGCGDYLFDVIISNHMLEHIQDDRKALS